MTSQLSASTTLVGIIAAFLVFSQGIIASTSVDVYHALAAREEMPSTSQDLMKLIEIKRQKPVRGAVVAKPEALSFVVKNDCGGEGWTERVDDLLGGGRSDGDQLLLMALEQPELLAVDDEHAMPCRITEMGTTNGDDTIWIRLSQDPVKVSTAGRRRSLAHEHKSHMKKSERGEHWASLMLEGRGIDRANGSKNLLAGMPEPPKRQDAKKNLMAGMPPGLKRQNGQLDLLGEEEDEDEEGGCGCRRLLDYAKYVMDDEEKEETQHDLTKKSLNVVRKELPNGWKFFLVSK